VIYPQIPTRYMRHPLLFGGNFLLTTPDLIEVVDFKAWRKINNPREERKRRRFSPYLTLRCGETLLKLVGYSAVWEFLDAIQPNLPRIPINSVMKGYEFYDTETMSFLEEVGWFLVESDEAFVGFKIEDNGLARAIKKPLSNIPIASKEYTGMSELTLFDATRYYVAILESKCTNKYFVYTIGYGVRPLKGKVFNKIDEAQMYAVRTSDELAKVEDVLGHQNLRFGMFDEEVDILENELFFQLLEEKKNQITT